MALVLIPQRHGHGTFTYKNGDQYEGDFKEDHMNGHGKYTKKDGTVWVGQAKNNRFEMENAAYSQFWNPRPAEVFVSKSGETKTFSAQVFV